MTRRVTAALLGVLCAASAMLAGCAAGGATAPQGLTFAGYIERTLNPEDMVALPHTRWVVTSTDQTPGKPKPGYLYLVDATTRTAALVDATVSAHPTSGDPACKPMPLQRMALNGLGLAMRPEGGYRLLAVNRGERMSIEFFDIDGAESSPTFRWTGCVLMPPKAFPNDVVAIGDGGLAVSVSFETDNTQLIEQMEQERKTGYVLEWTRARGFIRVPGSELSFNNGLAFDPAKQVYYLAGWGSKTLLRVPAPPATGQPLLERLPIRPDNITWSQAGTLIIAGHTQAPADVFRCVPTSADICPVPFKVIEVDPGSLRMIRVLVDGESMADYAGGTTGLEVGDELWVSSFRYDKIARYRR